MPSVCLYDPATGRITLNCVLSDDSHTHLTQQEEPRIDGHFDAAQFYVVNAAATPRPANPATLSGTTLANLPSPCTLVINGTRYDCTDTTANLTLSPGNYQVQVLAWPMQDAHFTVRV